MDNSSSLTQLLKRGTQFMVLAYQVVVLVVFIGLPFWAADYFRTPFLGVFMEHTMITNGVGPTEDFRAAPENWTLFRQGLDDFGSQLVKLSLLNQDGEIAKTIEPRSYAELQEFLDGHFPGETVEATFLDSNQNRLSYRFDLASFNQTDQWQFFFTPYLVGLVFLLTSLGIFGFRRGETAGRAFAILSSSVALVTGSLFNLYTTNIPFVTTLWVLSVPIVGAALFHLGMVFPQEARLVSKYPYSRWAGYIIGGGLAILNASTIFRFDEPSLYAAIWRYGYIFTGLGVVFFIGSTIYRRYWSNSPVVRQQAKAIFVGEILGFGPMTFWLLANFIPRLNLNFNPYIFFVPLIFFPALTGYTVMRYRLLRTDYVLGRGILYTGLTLLALSGYVLLTVGLGLILNRPIAPNNYIIVGMTVIWTAFVLNPVRLRLQQIIDSIFFRGETAHQERIKTFTRELTNAFDLNDVLRILREQISISLLPSHLHIYVYDALADQYIATPDETRHPTSDIRFASNSILPKVLGKEKVPLFVDEDRMPSAIQAERGRIALLGAHLFVPMPGRERLIGWVALGERLSGETYASHDISFLESLGSQSAVALERAQVVTNMERRVHEMNVLSRVAQGINITLNFDDILELIYAQTTQIIPGSDFHLTLYNKNAQTYYYSFFLENDERIASRENIPLIPKSSLEQEVILSRRAIMTQDFAAQCQVLGITPHVKGLYAWLGVPLNTGAETIGALSISARDPGVSYTTAQLELMQAIADQAAGAIVKSRLLRETEQRAQQLSILNVITRQLTSTLDLQPLLKNILENAVQILNAEAGSLFLADNQTDELVFEVTVGPVASNLVGQRLPAGTGFVGKAVTTRRPVIVNDVQASATWNSDPDKQTGFVTRAILAVPMEVKDRVNGVIEVINKKDGSPFNEDDQNLLAAFGGQAAVAIENARLYTLTDQELNARVEELSVMQRIDRELNTSLEVDRAMRITLEWALRQSKAEAGFIGFIYEKGISLVANQGYANELTAYEEALIPLEHPAVVDPLASGQPVRSIPTAQSAFLSGAQSQLVIPVRREASVIGVLILESQSSERFQPDALAFLSRLSDHAAIAITNAQLFAEVQAANIAKSEFVSFVAHELKNPMTSIKGYAELLSAGAVGPITDMQSNFLVTIRSNIERMKTIVEDLNDNSKIEAGRLRLDFRAVDVSELVDDAFRSTKRQIEDKKQTITINVPANLPKIWADRTRIGQILINLVSNAHKYTQEGGEITVSAERSDNIWDPQGAKEVVHIWVADNGIGISPEDQKKIFQKFFRSEDDQARKSPGTGLGLNITRSLAEMQGGKIWFESEFRKGTIFHVTVPVSEN
jgi:signal transduction histidine kinase